MKIKFFLMIILTSIISTSCIYQDIRIPGPTNKITNFQFDTSDFKIVGMVEAEGEIVTILGLFQTGGNGESVLYEKAKKLGADDITNYSYDLKSYSILTVIYNKATWKARATAIKYTDKARGKSLKKSEPATDSE